MKFSQKYADLLLSKNKFDVLEGTTYSGKTTFGAGCKFMHEVAESSKKGHGMAAKDVGVFEKNVINAENGILAEWGDHVEYNGNGTANIRIPHIVFTQDDGTQKIIYVFGYDDRKRWQKVLGGQLGCLYVDEANIADMDFITEASIRCDYMLWTLNPDSPDLPIYEQYINHCRPLEHHKQDYPSELLMQLNQPPKCGWVHWYFTFDDNVGCTDEKKADIISRAPIGSKLYKNKILGLRGYSEGLLYAGLLENVTIYDISQIDVNSLEEIVATVDVGSSTDPEDTKRSHTIVSIGGYSRGYKRIVQIASKRITSVEHLDIIREAENWLYDFWVKYYGKFKTIVIDSAARNLIFTWRNHSRWGGAVTISGSIKTSTIAPNLIERAKNKQQLMHKSPQFPNSRIVWCDPVMVHAHRQILSDKDGAELDQGDIHMDYADCFSYLMLWRLKRILRKDDTRNANPYQPKIY